MPTSYGSSSDYDVNGLNQITAETSGGTTLTVGYDKNGNLTSDGVTTYGYDLFNRLVSSSGGTALDYDAASRLYSIATPTSYTYFVYDGQALIAEYSIGVGLSVSMQRRYVHGLDVDTPIIWYEGSGVTNATRRYLVADELGSIALVTDSAGSALHHNVYDEYGVPGSGNVGRFQYTGQAWLDESGLYYYKARVYNPYLGRFQQTDPIGYGDGMNMYAYVGNDPVNKIDPTGLEENEYRRRYLISGKGDSTSTSRAEKARFGSDPAVNSEGEIVTGVQFDVGSKPPPLGNIVSDGIQPALHIFRQPGAACGQLGSVMPTALGEKRGSTAHAARWLAQSLSALGCFSERLKRGCR